MNFPIFNDLIKQDSNDFSCANFLSTFSSFSSFEWKTTLEIYFYCKTSNFDCFAIKFHMKVEWFFVSRIIMKKQEKTILINFQLSSLLANAKSTKNLCLMPSAINFQLNGLKKSTNRLIILYGWKGFKSVKIIIWGRIIELA